MKGFTKYYRRVDGARCLAFREGELPNFTIFVKGLRVQFFYVAVRLGSRIWRWHTKRKIDA